MRTSHQTSTAYDLEADFHSTRFEEDAEAKSICHSCLIHSGNVDHHFCYFIVVKKKDLALLLAQVKETRDPQ